MGGPHLYGKAFMVSSPLQGVDGCWLHWTWVVDVRVVRVSAPLGGLQQAVRFLVLYVECVWIALLYLFVL